MTPEEYKIKLAEDLEKRGYTLQDLEDGLSKLDKLEGVQKVAEILGMTKTADPLSWLKNTGSFLGSLLSKLFLGSLYAGGAAGGLAATGAKQLDSEDKESMEIRKEKALIEAATRHLREQFGLPLTTSKVKETVEAPAPASESTTPEEVAATRTVSAEPPATPEAQPLPV